MRRTLFAVALAAALAPPLQSGLFDPLWSLLSPLWGATSNTDAGCGMDPYGQCLPAQQPASDEGAGLDPWG